MFHVKTCNFVAKIHVSRATISVSPNFSHGFAKPIPSLLIKKINQEQEPFL